MTPIQKVKRRKIISLRTNSSILFSYPWITLHSIIKSRIAKEPIAASFTTSKFIRSKKEDQVLRERNRMLKEGLNPYTGYIKAEDLF